MRFPEIVLLRIRSLVFRRRIDEELDEELRYHIERQIEAEIAAGMSPAAARQAALRSAWGLAQRKEECRDMRGWNIFDHLLHDLRFSVRQLRKNPGFTAAAVLMLALGISASVSIFAFVDAALLHPLPYRHPERLVGVYGSIPLCPQCNVSYPDYVDLKKMNQVFSSIDAYNSQGYILRTHSGAELARGAGVTAGFFRTLGVSPILGRDFADGEDTPSAARVTILSYASWQSRFGGRRDVIGQTVTLAGNPHTIVGVLPRNFHFSPVGQPEFWTALHAVGGCFDRRSCHGLYAIARLNDGVSLETAAANIQSIVQQLERQYPDSNRGQGSNLTPLSEVIVGNIRPILLVLLIGAGLLMLIAGVNVASLLLVRSEGRRREIAVRSGLGASRGRLMSQFVTEGLVLMAAGAGFGLLGAHWTIKALSSIIPSDMRPFLPFLNNLGFNPRVLAFAGFVSLLGAFLFTFIPGSRISRPDLRGDLAEGARGSSGTVWRRFGANLVVLELATAVVLLVSAGLLAQSLYRVLQVNLGFRPDHLATVRVAAPTASYSKDEQVAALGREVVSRIRELPGVESAAITSTLPVAGGNTVWIRIVGKPYSGEHNEVAFREISPAYFTTLRARLLRGRMFADTDDRSKPLVVIIDQSLAKRYFQGEDPIGQKIVYASSPAAKPMEVIGVVGDIKEGALDKTTWPTLYVAFNQDPSTFFSLVVRTSQDEQSVLRSVSAVIRHIDPGITISNPIGMNEMISHTSAAYLRSSSAWLVGGFAALALLLGVIGLYGVIAYSVSRRAREIGVRIALGAQPGAVYGLILREAGRLIGLGVILGLAAALAAATLMRSLLFGIQVWDIPTLTVVAVLLALSGFLASYLPARRAAAMNPIDALRAE